MTSIKSGDYVRHTACPEWGNGVVADIKGSMAIVLFENSERPREFRVPSPFLKPAPEAAADPPKVSHLKSQMRAKGKSRSSGSRTTRSFDEVVISFRSTYPEGFESEAWAPMREQRSKIFDLLNSGLSHAKWKELVEAGNFDELARLHREFVQKAGLMHPVQASKISAIKDGAFWFSYGEWVWRKDGPESACEEFLKGLSAAQQASWPNMSALRGVLYVQTDAFVKPDSVKRTAAALKQELPYDSKPTHGGYRQIVDFTKKVKERLEKEGLKPADLWDVSQFFRLVAGRPLDSSIKKPRAKSTRSKKAAADAKPAEV